MSRLIGRIPYTEERNKVTFNAFYQTMPRCRTGVFFFFRVFRRAKARGLFQALRPLSLFFLFTSPCASGHNLNAWNRLASARRAKHQTRVPRPLCWPPEGRGVCTQATALCYVRPKNAQNNPCSAGETMLVEQALLIILPFTY